MKRIFFLLVFVAAITVWCLPSFADPGREGFAGPGGTKTITTLGQTGGVDLTAQGTGSILDIVAGYDVFKFNNPLGTATNPIAISTDVSSQSQVVFLGNSTVYGNVGSSGGIFAEIHGGAASTRVDLLGNVWTQRIIFDHDSTISLGAGKTADGGAAVTTTAGINTGTLVLGGGSNLGGTGTSAVTGVKSINIEGGSNTAGVSATITGAVGTHSLDLLTNTLNIGGALTMTTNGVINTTLASPTLYGHAVVTGASNLGTGLDVEALVPSTAYIPVGTKFYIVQSTSGTGALATVTIVDPTNPLYTFSVDDSASAGAATIKTTGIPLTASITPPPDVVLPPAAPVAAVVASTLTDIPNPSPDLTSVLAAINAISDPVAVVNAEAQLAPSTPALAAPLVTFQGLREFQNLWLSRLDTCSQDVNETDANCQGNEPRNGWWVKGFEYFGSQGARGVSTGYRSRIAGTMIACDAPIGLDTRAGLGFGYAQSTINGKTFDADTDFDTYQATAYIGHEDGPWFLNGSASLGWNDYSSMRHIVFTGVDRKANADYSGQDYTAFASTGFHLSVQEFAITPLASLQYSHMHLTGYTEKDAGDVDLKVNSQDYDFLESGLGVKVERYFRNRDGTSYVPEGHFNWYHELSNPGLEQTAEYTAAGSGSFTTSGLKTADDTFNVGGGLTLLSCVCSATTWSLEAVYDYDWTNDGYSANQVMIRFTSRF
jgi:outer membrane autotransporter protein